MMLAARSTPQYGGCLLQSNQSKYVSKVLPQDAGIFSSPWSQKTAPCAIAINCNMWYFRSRRNDSPFDLTFHGILSDCWGKGKGLDLRKFPVELLSVGALVSCPYSIQSLCVTPEEKGMGEILTLSPCLLEGCMVLGKLVT